MQAAVLAGYHGRVSAPLGYVHDVSEWRQEAQQKGREFPAFL
jgi:hypothetical protein